jgi:fructokinase
MRSIYAIGETTFDIVFRDNNPFRGVVGGSSLNTAVSLGRLQLPVSFISRFGNDTIGDLSAAFLIENGVNCRYISRFEGQSRIALAFLDKNNNASYQFYHGNKSPRLTFPPITKNDIITFGSLNAIANKGRKNLLNFLTKASNVNAITVYDPNIRNIEETERESIVLKVEENIALSTIVKGSTEDFVRLYGTSDCKLLFKKFSNLGVKALFITNGDRPVTLITNRFKKSYQVKKVDTVSTIGAGDNFTAGVIFGLWGENISAGNIDSTDEKLWDEIVAYGCHFAREVCLSESNYISEEFASIFSKITFNNQ